MHINHHIHYLYALLLLEHPKATGAAGLSNRTSPSTLHEHYADVARIKQIVLAFEQGKMRFINQVLGLIDP